MKNLFDAVVQTCIPRSNHDLPHCGTQLLLECPLATAPAGTRLSSRCAPETSELPPVCPWASVPATCSVDRSRYRDRAGMAELRVLCGAGDGPDTEFCSTSPRRAQNLALDRGERVLILRPTRSSFCVSSPESGSGKLYPATTPGAPGPCRVFCGANLGEQQPPFAMAILGLVRDILLSQVSAQLTGAEPGAPASSGIHPPEKRSSVLLRSQHDRLRLQFQRRSAGVRAAAPVPSNAKYRPP